MEKGGAGMKMGGGQFHVLFMSEQGREDQLRDAELIQDSLLRVFDDRSSKQEDIHTPKQEG